MESTIAKMRAEGKTQAEVADLLGTTQTNISKIEKKMKQRR
jgi:transcriptional regulator